MGVTGTVGSEVVKQLVLTSTGESIRAAVQLLEIFKNYFTTDTTPSVPVSVPAT
jgi:hypothetical protein